MNSATSGKNFEWKHSRATDFYCVSRNMLDKQTQILNLSKSEHYFHNCLNDFVK